MSLFIINVIIHYIYGHSSVVRAQVSKTWCREFKSLCPCQICLFTPEVVFFIFALIFYFILVYNGYVMDLVLTLIVGFIASFIFGGFILWIISFFIAEKVKKENFTFVNFIIILVFLLPSLWVIISRIIYVNNSVCDGAGIYTCSSIVLNLFFWFYPIHFALPLIFGISRKKSRLQKLESQKFKNNSQ